MCIPNATAFYSRAVARLLIFGENPWKLTVLDQKVVLGLRACAGVYGSRVSVTRPWSDHKSVPQAKQVVAAPNWDQLGAGPGQKILAASCAFSVWVMDA